jgi:hypothetical protein
VFFDKIQADKASQEYWNDQRVHNVHIYQLVRKLHKKDLTIGKDAASEGKKDSETTHMYRHAA